MVERFNQILLKMLGTLEDFKSTINKTRNHIKPPLGAQWLSGRVLDSRTRGSGFEPHLCHCVVVLEQDTFIPA